MIIGAPILELSAGGKTARAYRSTATPRIWRTADAGRGAWPRARERGLLRLQRLEPLSAPRVLIARTEREVCGRDGRAVDECLAVGGVRVWGTIWPNRIGVRSRSVRTLLSKGEGT